MAAAAGQSQTIPTAMQQRMDWCPTEGEIFQTMTDFKLQLDAYQFVSGRRFEKVGRRGGKRDRHKAVFRCTHSGQGMRIVLRFQRPRTNYSWWVVTQVDPTECTCGAAPSIVAELRRSGMGALEGKVGIVKRQDWQLLASACFPSDFHREPESQRVWIIRCKRENCPGEYRFSIDYKCGYKGANLASTDAVIDCCRDCKIGKGCTGERFVATEAPSSPTPAISCSICTQDDLDRWVEFSCCNYKNMACRECLQNLVRCCPKAIQRTPDVVIFKPNELEGHFHSCPFCNGSYGPDTVFRSYQRNGADGRVEATDKRVGDLVETPYGYQSFARDFPAHFSEGDYHTVLQQCHDQEVEDLRRLTRPQTLDALVDNVLRPLPEDNFLRLREVARSPFFRQHRQSVLNFLEALEFLHDSRLDGGFLRRVGHARDWVGRMNLLRGAYFQGWRGVNRQFRIEYRLVLALLVRKEVVTVVDLVAARENENGSDDGNDPDGEGHEDSGSNNDDDHDDDYYDNDEDDDDE